MARAAVLNKTAIELTKYYANSGSPTYVAEGGEIVRGAVIQYRNTTVCVTSSQAALDRKRPRGKLNEEGEEAALVMRRSAVLNIKGKVFLPFVLRSFNSGQ